jgi:hypothetical protein
VSFYHGGYCDPPAAGELGSNPGHEFSAVAATDLYNFAQNDYEAGWQGQEAAHHPINILSSGTQNSGVL